MMRVLAGLLVAGAAFVSVAAMADTTRTALALWGEPQLPATFKQFPYVNPQAPKGGRIVIGQVGTFDSLNTLILRGVTPRIMGLIADTLMTASDDELSAAYPLLVDHVDLADDLGAAVFHLRAGARWHDGAPIEAGDVVYAWDMIQAHGAPFVKSFLTKTKAVSALDPQQVRVTFSTTGEMKPILDFATTLAPMPRHWWTQPGRDPGKTTLEPILGSGPYEIAAVDAGRSITLKRVIDYWGRNLPANRGLYNFDEVRVDYYRDDDVMFEAFKAGAYDFRVESRARRWASGYDFPAIIDGRVSRRALSSDLPLGAQGFRINTRRPQLADPRVREALAWLFDYQWIHKNILYDQYARVKSDFPNSDYGASGAPSPQEIALLEPYRDEVDPRVLTTAFDPPEGGDMRTAQRRALQLLKDAGWDLVDGQLKERVTGKPLAVEILEDDDGMTRVVQPYVTSLRRAGVMATVRVVDPAQYQVRLDTFDFDITVANFNFFPPPGEELRSYFGSAAAGEQGSANLSGIRLKSVDGLIEKVLSAKDESSVKLATRALDRVLLWGWYMIPQWYNRENWLAYWNRFGWPDRWPKYDLTFRNNWFPASWWSLPDAGKPTSRP